MRILLAILALALLVTGCDDGCEKEKKPPPEPADQGTVSVQVMGEDGTPVDGVTVILDSGSRGIPL